MATTPATPASKVKQIFEGLHAEELKAVVRDLIALDDTGILPLDGSARLLMRRLQEETGIPHKDAHHLVLHHTLRMAAFKWANS
jgi:hypothetical protein